MLLTFYCILSTCNQCTLKKSIIELTNSNYHQYWGKSQVSYIKFWIYDGYNTSSSQRYWEEASQLLPNMQFFTAECSNEAKMFCDLVSNSSLISTYPTYRIYLPNSTTHRATFNENNLSLSYITNVAAKIANNIPFNNQMIETLIPQTIYSFFNSYKYPIYLLYNSNCQEDITFIDHFFKKLSNNEINLKNDYGFGKIDCGKYTIECNKWGKQIPSANIFLHSKNISIDITKKDNISEQYLNEQIEYMNSITNSEFQSDCIKTEDFLYEKIYPSFGKVSYHCEYLGVVDRKLPGEARSENILSPDRIPTYNNPKSLTTEEKEQCRQESQLITASSTSFASGSYDSIDKNGFLYNEGKKVENERKLYKHVGSNKNYLGDVSDDEPAIIKKITLSQINGGCSITGLYAPPGEVITIKIAESELNKIENMSITIGQVFQNGQSNVILGNYKDYPRMPALANTFILSNRTTTCEHIDSDYLFYVGSFLGGPIYVSTQASCIYTIEISGAVRYPHFILGYTSEEEFEENWNSSAPYLDILVWQRGILLSGPKRDVTIRSYSDFYKVAIYWEKVASVSSQFPCSPDKSLGIHMLYDCYIPAGNALSYKGKNTAILPINWFPDALDIENIINGKEIAWGSHHEYNHHFQEWGMENEQYEVNNNALTLVSFAYFTKISSSRNIKNEQDDYTWDKYTSSSFVLDKIVKHKAFTIQPFYYACLLHCLGQKLFIEAANNQKNMTNDDYYRSYSEVTELDMTYFFRDLCEIKISDEIVDFIKKKNYKNFVPIASIYQTGVGYAIKGNRNVIETMQPYRIDFNKDFTIDFNSSLIVPKGFSFDIVSVRQPMYGTISMKDKNIYVYSPSPDDRLSGKITFKVKLTKNEDPSFFIDDIDMYLGFENIDHNSSFNSPNVFPKKYFQTSVNEINAKGTLVDCTYSSLPGNEDQFDINNLFDEDDMNIIHSSSINESNPFIIVADLGDTYITNHMTIYGSLQSIYQYQPKDFILYGGIDKDHLEIIKEVTNAPISNRNVPVNFDAISLRYYKLKVTKTYAKTNNYVSYRYIKFGVGLINATVVSLDDEKVMLYNSCHRRCNDSISNCSYNWKKIQKFCTFGHLYVGQGSNNSLAKGTFQFTGTQFGINSYFSSDYESFDLYIDDEKVKIIDIKDTTESGVKTCYLSHILERKKHVIRFESDKRFNIDSFFADIEDELENPIPIETPMPTLVAT